MKHEKVSIRSIQHITHDVLQITADKPAALHFTPGQATEVFIDKPGWENEGRPFTFTSLPGDDHVQFTIKTYPERNGVTAELLNLSPGDTLILNDVFGDIAYKGRGVFIAGGAGITPFISILRQLQAEGKTENNKLIFANKSKGDIIYEAELSSLLGNNFINILSEDNDPSYAHGFITEGFLRDTIESFHVYFYVCGPPPMMDAVLGLLDKIGVHKEQIITESF